MFGFKKRKTNLKLSDVDDNWLYAPLSGEVVPLEEVHDAVFSQKVMGDGIGIEPVNNILYSPVNGTVSMIFPTGHALGIDADNGARIIIHIGIDTVELHGKGFDVLVSKGDRVKTGEALVKVDFKQIKEKYEITTMIIIENSGEYHLSFSERKKINAGEKLIEMVK